MRSIDSANFHSVLRPFGLQGLQTQNHIFSNFIIFSHKFVPVQQIYLIGMASFDFASHRLRLLVGLAHFRYRPGPRSLVLGPLGENTM